MPLITHSLLGDGDKSATAHACAFFCQMLQPCLRSTLSSDVFSFRSKCCAVIMCRQTDEARLGSVLAGCSRAAPGQGTVT
eukprot:5404706-Prymnesium_polylepis.1